MKYSILKQTSTRCLAIINPVANKGRSRAIWNKIKPTLKRQGLSPEEIFTKKQGHAQRLTRQALYNGNDIVFAVGGDGIINEVVNGFFNNKEAINESAILGVVKSGSCSDFVKTLKEESDSGNHKKCFGREIFNVDVACVEYETAGSNHLTRYFINIADVGIGASTAYKVEKFYKKLGGRTGFFFGALATVIGYKNRYYKLVLDKNNCRSGKYSTVVAANGRYFGGGMKIAPEAKFNDGCLNVITVGDISKIEFFINILKVYRGKHLNNPHVKSYQVKDLVISAKEPFFMETDGECFTAKMVKVTVLPKQIRVCLF